jgi:excinuclease ABC subunit C
LLTKIQNIIQSLPTEPGVYQFFNSKNELVYVGKAKNLRKRVVSYFSRELENRKLQVLVSQIADIKFVIVENEQEALLLENNLIKKNKPRYNVLLKDDKTFPWICIKNERFPRVFITRNYIDDGSEYFGPYTSVIIVRTLLNLVAELYPLRNCNLDLSDNKIKLGKYTPCLEFHMGNCLAPCVSKQTEEDYDNNIKLIRKILKGNISGVLTYLKDLMNSYSVEYKYEDAQKVKERISIIEKYRNKSVVVNPDINDVDVFSCVEKDNSLFVNYLKVIDGAIVQVHNLELRKKLDEPKEELLQMAIAEIRDKLKSEAREIIIPFDIDADWEKIFFTIPKIGDKLKLLELSERNARIFAIDKGRSETKIKVKGVEALLVQMKNELHLKEIPRLIECFDNSNLQGSNPVASCVVFKNAKPLKSEYRHFNIKTVLGPNDYASMEEIIFRRYKHLLEEDKQLPQLIVIDGGKGQLNAALNSLHKLEIADKIDVISIAKKLEEIYVVNDPVPLYIDKNSSTLKVIQHIRNEAHRFGVTFHRNKRSKDMLTSELDMIQGIGEKTKELLLKKYKSIENIKALYKEELEKIAGKAKAAMIVEHFKKEKA